MLVELQLPSVARDLPHDEPQHEDNLLVEAVSLLVQRQRETEAWVAEQIDEASQRSALVERRYAELESRLAALEEQLSRLGRDFGSGAEDGAAGQRLARLREQVADLRSEPVEGRQLRSLPPSVSPSLPPAIEPSVAAPTAPGASPTVAAGGMWSVFGATPRERFGLLAMFLGLVAVLYAVLSQLRF